jgi:hypothetical protein
MNFGTVLELKSDLSICNLFIEVKSLAFSRLLLITNSRECKAVLILCFLCVLLKYQG